MMRMFIGSRNPTRNIKLINDVVKHCYDNNWTCNALCSCIRSMWSSYDEEVKRQKARDQDGRYGRDVT